MAPKTVVIALDTTDEADDVVRTAKDIVGDASITLLSVIQPVTYAYGPEPASFAGTYDFEGEAAKIAGARLQELATEHKLDCECVTLIGRPANEIRKYAEETAADLIIIGNHGRRGLGLLLGSTANGVLHGAPCDVYVVRIAEDDA